MEKIVKQTLLYDFYGELLTDHQKKIYEDVILNDYSLSEIAEEAGISRQGVHDLVKRCNKILTGYEEKLQLIEKFINTKEKINQIYKLAKECDTLEVSEHSRLLKRIEEISMETLKEL